MANETARFILTPAELRELADAIAERVVERLASRPRYLGREDMAHELSVSVPTLDRWTKDGDIPSIKMAGRVLYCPEDVHDFLRTMRASHENAAAAQAAIPLWCNRPQLPDEIVGVTHGEASHQIGGLGFVVIREQLEDWAKIEGFPGEFGDLGRCNGYFPCHEILAWTKAKGIELKKCRKRNVF